MPLVRAYGDTTGDGMVQLSFTLPVPAGPRAEAAATLFAKRMGLDPALLVHAKAVGERFTFFVVYGRSSVVVELDEVTVIEREFPLLTVKDINLQVRSRLNRRLVVVGATVGTDAHTVGLDAILNVKGFAGEKGLESYREIRVVNHGAQVAADDLVRRAAAEPADAVLVSQVVTQRDPTCTTSGRSPTPSPPTGRPAGPGRCFSSAGRASTRRPRPSSAPTACSPRGPRRARSRPTSFTP